MRSLRIAPIVMLVLGGSVCEAMADPISECRRAKSASEKVERCTRALELDRSSRSRERAFLRRGNAFVELGEYARAIDDFSALIALNPRVPGYFDNRLHAYRSLGRLGNALEDAERTVRMAPSQAFGYRSRGLVYSDMNKLELAVSDFSAAIQFDPGNAGLFIDRGKLLVRETRLREAVADFSRALQIDGRAMDAYRERGLTFLRLGEPDAAAADLNPFSRLHPNDVEVSRALANLHAARTQPAAPPSAPPKHAESSRDPDELQVSSGTGFFVSQDGNIVSNAHVVEGCARAQVKYGLAQFQEAQLLARDSANDLALLKTDIKPRAVASLRAGVRIGENVAAFGYPLSGILASTGNFTVGNVSALAGMADDTRFIQISVPVQPGNSGGPVLDQSGNVVGVVVAKLNAMKLAKLTDDLAQNVNFAIKTTVLENFLETSGVVFATSGPGQILASADLADRGKSISVMIRCRPRS